MFAFGIVTKSNSISSTFRTGGLAGAHVVLDRFVLEQQPNAECKLWDVAAGILREFGWSSGQHALVNKPGNVVLA